MKSFFWGTSFFLNLLITMLVMALLAWLFMPSMQNASGQVIGMSFGLFGILCGGLAGLRTRLEGISIPRAVIPAILRSMCIALTTTASVALVLQITGMFPLLARSEFPPAMTVLRAAFSAPVFLTAQIFGWIWRWWKGMRERRFVWALTHALLSAVTLLGVVLLLVGLVAISYLIISDLENISRLPPSPAYSIFVRAILWLMILIFATLIFVIAAVLFFFPLVLLFSYRVAQGITRRVESLASVTGRVRSGDLTARVPVEGSDELAELQSNFNAMAEDLESHAQQVETHTRELEQARDRFDHLLQAHRDLTANVSHELRTPISTLSASLDLALTHWIEQPVEVLHQDLEVMNREIKRLERLIDDLFTLSRVEVDQLSLHLQPVDVIPLIRGMVETVEKTAWQTRKVQIIAEMEDDLPWVQADPARLEQMMRNLLQNSLRHTSPGGYVLVSARKVEDRMRIEVADSGEGIPANDLPHIWERFYRSAAAEQLGDGAGLGLALVKELADAMGARVGVETCPGEGSTFWIEVPLLTM